MTAPPAVTGGGQASGGWSLPGDAGFDAGSQLTCESGTQDNDDNGICLPACDLDSCSGDLLCNDISGVIVCQCPAGRQDNNSDGLCVTLCTDSDLDLDDVCAAADNCPDTSNLSQVDTDGDGIGDACDPNPNHHQDDINFILEFASGCGSSLDTEDEILSFGGQMWQAYRLTELELMEQGFSGCGIPTSLGQVSALRILILPGNNLEGVIPETITLLEDLFILDLRDNLLTGPIPSSWDIMPGIETIDLQNNALSGFLL